MVFADESSTPEGRAELEELFHATAAAYDDGTVSSVEMGRGLLARPDLLSRFTGLDADSSTRLSALCMVGRFDVWVLNMFRRLGIRDEDYLTCDQFVAQCCGAAPEASF